LNNNSDSNDDKNQVEVTLRKSSLLKEASNRMVMGYIGWVEYMKENIKSQYSQILFSNRFPTNERLTLKIPIKGLNVLYHLKSHPEFGSAVHNSFNNSTGTN